MRKDWTGERLETFINNQDSIDHLHRYAIASDYVTGKTVLDIACGEGYGSNLLCKQAASVYGVDISIDAINRASEKYRASNLRFIAGSADSIPMDDYSVDVVVSFETIEHHSNHKEMMLEIKRVLKPEGVLIISTPDKHFYSDVRHYQNPFHVKELYKDEFRNLLADYFSNLQLLKQQFVNGNSVITDEDFTELKVYKGDYFNNVKMNVLPLYLLAVAANVELDKQTSSIFDGSLILEKPLVAQMQAIYDSRTYKIGRLLLWPFKIFRKYV